MLIGSIGRAGCCVILARAVLSRVLKTDVLDNSVCVVRSGVGGSGMLGLFSSAVLVHVVMIPVVVAKCECF